MKKLLLIVFTVFFLFSSCQKDEDPTTWKNQIPIIESVTANPDTILVNGETTLICIATDPDGDSLTIEWKAKAGLFPIINTGKSVKWKAPDSVGIYPITAFVTDGKDTESDTVYVTVVKTPQPILKTPSDNAVDVSIPATLEWEAINGVIGYNLQVSTDSLFSTLIFNQGELVDNSQQIEGLNYLTKYYWRVRATNSYGTSNWSTTWSFTTLSQAGGQPCPGTPTVTYAGKTYNTVLIGTQCWLKENLDVGTMIQGTQNQVNNEVIEKYCYDNNPVNCNTYGGLYQWDEAMQYGTTPGTRGICPPSWHVPTSAEFETLKAAVNNDGNKLKKVGQGSGSSAGTNTSGFSALLAGHRGTNGNFYNLGHITCFWSSTEASSTWAIDMNLDYYNSDVILGTTIKNYGFSVRCLQD